MWGNVGGRNPLGVELSFESEESEIQGPPDLGKKGLAFERLDLSLSRADHEDDDRSISYHAIDKPLLKSSTTKKCPSLTKLRPKPLANTANQAKSTPLSEHRPVHSFVSSFLSVEARDDVKKRKSVSSPEGDEVQTREPAEGASKPDSVTGGISLDARSSSDYDSQAENNPAKSKPFAYDMSSCSSTSATNQESQPVIVEDVEEEEPLLSFQESTLINCLCSNQQPQQPKYARRSTKRHTLTNPSVPAQQRRFFAFNSEMCRKYKNMGHEVEFEMLGEPVFAQNISLREFIAFDDSSISAKSFVAASDTSNSNNSLRQLKPTSKPASLTYDDLQARFKNELELHDELDQMVKRAVGDIPEEGHQGYFPVVNRTPIFLAVDTLRVPLDAQLSTLYEDDDEDSDIRSSMASLSFMNHQINHCKTKKLVEYLRRDAMCSFDYYNSSLHDHQDQGEEENDGERLLGETLLDIDSPYTEKFVLRRRRLHDLVAQIEQESISGELVSSAPEQAPIAEVTKNEDATVRPNDVITTEMFVPNTSNTPSLPVLQVGSSQVPVIVADSESSPGDEECTEETQTILTSMSEISDLTDVDYRDRELTAPEETSSAANNNNTSHPPENFAKQLSNTKNELMKQFFAVRNLILPENSDQQASHMAQAAPSSFPKKEQGKSDANRPLKGLLKRTSFTPNLSVAKAKNKKKEKKYSKKRKGRNTIAKRTQEVDHGNVGGKKNDPKENDEKDNQLDSLALQRWLVADDRPAIRSRTCFVRLLPSVGSSTSSSSYPAASTDDEDVSREDPFHRLMVSDDEQSDPFADLHCVTRMAI